MKNIVTFYQGGSGGFFIYYYLLASDSNIFSKINMPKNLRIGQNKPNERKKKKLATVYNTIHALKKKGYLKEISINSDKSYFDTLKNLRIGQNKNFLDACFYHQFQKHTRLNNWKEREMWPTFKKVGSDSRQTFLCCNEIPKDFDASDSVIINPYIADKKKWLRMQANKRCLGFFGIPKNISRKDFFIHYKKIYRGLTENSKVKDADYFFDFFKFLRDKDERKKLCDFLKIDINPRMEDYLTHYIDCHGKLFDKLIK